MRVVLDTNIVVSASLTPEGSSATIVDLALAGSFKLCLSAEVLAEYREVLARPRFLRQAEKTAVLLEGSEDIAVIVKPANRLSACQDQDDNRILECVDAARAEFLVTGNLKHSPSSFGITRILSPRDFLRSDWFLVISRIAYNHPEGRIHADL